MKKSAVTCILLWSMIASVAGCGAGPCAGYGCPAFAPVVAQAPQQPASHAQTHQALTQRAEAQNDQVVRPVSPSGE